MELGYCEERYEYEMRAWGKENRAPAYWRCCGRERFSKEGTWQMGLREEISRRRASRPERRLRKESVVCLPTPLLSNPAGSLCVAVGAAVG